MEPITDAILQLMSSPWLYLVMFATAAIDGIFPPIPSETVLVAAVAMSWAGGGDVDVLALAGAAAAGALLGDSATFALGARIGVDRFRWMRRPRSSAALAWARHALERRGARAILVGRYIPVGRVAVNLVAGATGMPATRFVPLAALAAASWAAYGALIGIVAGHWAQEYPLLGALIGIAIAVAIGAVADTVVRARERRRRPDLVDAAVTIRGL